MVTLVLRIQGKRKKLAERDLAILTVLMKNFICPQPMAVMTADKEIKNLKEILALTGLNDKMNAKNERAKERRANGLS